MKLELKHLAPYLPYGLKVQAYRKIYPRSTEVNILNTKNLDLYLDKRVYTIKPILRPLSDLTKEIEVNGEKFVPNEYFNQNSDKYYLPNDWDAIIFIGKKNINSVNYLIIQKLFEWHFDVFGLIEKGLAIDINTLDK